MSYFGHVVQTLVVLTTLFIVILMQCLKKRPSLILPCGMQPRLSMLSESHATNPGGVSSELSSSDSGSDA